MRRRATPSKEFLLRLETRLFPKQEIMYIHYMRFLRLAVVPAVLVITLLASTGGYAYASPRVLPGHMLYPMRQGVEGMEMQIATLAGLKMKDRVRLRQLERRAREKMLLEERTIQKQPQKKIETTKFGPQKPAPKPASKAGQGKAR